MTTKHSSLAWGLLGALAPLLAGCDAALIDPKGDIGVQERSLIVSAILWMLVVVIPVFAMTALFVWRYRASNPRARYEPGWHKDFRIEAAVWGVPAVIVVALGIATWQSTHELDPSRPIAADAPPIEIQVVALDWKWLFIYPKENVASVNELAFPVGVPVSFSVTSGSVMNAFFIPRLGSQIYAMSGMRTRLHLIADAPGVYPGMSSQYSGRGFSHMRFKARVGSRADFDAWIAHARAAPAALDAGSFAALAAPSEDHPVAYYRAVTPGFFETLIDEFRGAPH